MTPKRIARRKASCLFLFVVAAIGASALTISYFLPMSKSEDFDSVFIPPGSTVAEIGDILERKEVIRSSTAFQLVVRLMKKDRSLVSGEYKLSPGMSLYDVIQVLEKGGVVTAPVTFPEGITMVQIADLLSSRGFVVEEEFLDLCHSGRPSFGGIFPFLASDNLEGYLFPDTYRFAKGADANTIITTMLRNYDRRVTKASPTPTGFAKGYSDYQILVMASLVEREAKVPRDRKRIAGVLYNRLRIDMALQCDATIQYVLSKRKERLLLDDLKVDSPYNTYEHKGLPPTPICNPGLEALRAAYAPEVHSYLYYVARPDGSHIFSRTHDEHVRAKRQIERETRGREQRDRGR